VSTSGAAPKASGKREWKNEPLVLFVEGHSDLTFYAEVMEHVRHPLTDYFIHDLGGKDQCKGRTRLGREAALLLQPDNLARMQAVAVILDADADAAAAFALAAGALRSAVGVEVTVPEVWVPKPGSGPRFGIFMARGADGTGEVESLAWEAWKGMPANQPLRECVDGFVTCAEGKGVRLKSKDKVRIGAALAVQNEDDPRLGPGARARLIDLGAPALEPLCRFLAGMRVPPPQGSAAAC
jgi:hypothetical protein